MRLTWNPKWINPFESTWSIVEKIKYANAITSRELVREFGTKDYKGNLTNQRYGLLRLNGIDLEHLSLSTGTDFSNHINYYFNKMVGMLTHLNPNFLLRKEFTFCEDCLAVGYHSILHQFIFVQKCPHHLTELKNTCKICGSSSSCETQNHKRREAFECVCSNFYVDPKFNSFFEWQVNLPISDRVIKDWISMDSKTYNHISETYFYLPSLKNLNDPLQFLLNFGKGIY
ncbi:hypothetical protein FHS18_004192 [Paenibacillus phyllosphaerae]|uniref:TniQ protein n=1 Tax=Paenibacillus phyllosphaerae TaxID=274593 RepID=A0A7W5B0D9_9BACL|nr:hypothetical protein [Paenibacillus phyllosphaerae]MBB3112114.1 hypothetical protein [Paenibacillus phyllosphaerae]